MIVTICNMCFISVKHRISILLVDQRETNTALVCQDVLQSSMFRLSFVFYTWHTIWKRFQLVWFNIVLFVFRFQSSSFHICLYHLILPSFSSGKSIINVCTAAPHSKHYAICMLHSKHGIFRLDLAGRPETSNELLNYGQICLHFILHGV